MTESSSKNQTPTPSATKSFLDDDRCIEFAENLSLGLTEIESALITGYSREEIAHFRKCDSSYISFVELQKAKLKKRLLQDIKKSPSDKNSMWLLERFYPEEYGPKKKYRDEDLPSNPNYQGTRGGASEAPVLNNLIRAIQKNQDDGIEPRRTIQPLQNEEEKPRYDLGEWNAGESSAPIVFGGNAVL